MKKLIQLFEPFIDEDEEKSIKKTLYSKYWASGSGLGLVGTFEKKFQQYVGTKHCVSVNSGTAALHLALKISNVKNKEVLLPSMSFVSTANSVLYNQAKPIFVDIDPETLCLDPNEVHEKISDKTSVILPVHFGGMPCDLKAFQKISKNNGLELIEDAAHAAGTTYNGKKIGTHGDIVCFSFHPVKNLAMPNGGALTLNGKNTDEKIKILSSLRWCGISNRNGFDYDVKYLGFNFYMNEFSASIGLAQLKKLDKMNKMRKKIAKRYSKELKIETKMSYNNDSSYHIYWIQVKNRKKFMQEMKQHGIETGIHYHPIHKMSLYKNRIKLPVTEDVAKKIVSIPIHPNLKETEISKIIKMTNKFSK